MTELLPRQVIGPLAPHVEGFRDELVHAGYTPRSTRDHLYTLARLSRWLSENGIGVGALTNEVLERYIASQRATGRRRWTSVRAHRPLFDYLRTVGLVPEVAPSPPCSALEEVLDAHRQYLQRERRLAPSTVRTNTDVARRFLSTCSTEDSLSRVTPADVSAFVLDQAGRCSTGSMKVLTTALRSLLRFLLLAGFVEQDLAGAVPAVAQRRSSLPKGADRSTVDALLASCDTSTALGRRDRAILVLLVRLGLRAGEVAALRLDDVDWRAGEIVVRGKGNRLDRLPLPRDVGEAIADYLQHGRPPSPCRALFLRAFAPIGPITQRVVVMVPRRAASRAGVAVLGAHRLRHAAATAMLQEGASLSEIAQILRHDSESTTRIYAAVDRAALDQVVCSWPGAGR